MRTPNVPMAALELQDVTHQLVQQFIVELQDMLPDLAEGKLGEQQKKVLMKILAFFEKEMRSHHLEEEQRIFPLLLAKGDAQMQQAVHILQADHDALREGWQKLKTCIDSALATGQADRKRMQTCFDEYSARFASHLALEERIQFSSESKGLFQRWDSDIPPVQAPKARYTPVR